jgi:hypothetical protein
MRTLPHWLSDKIGHRHDPVRIVQDALSDTTAHHDGRSIGIICGELWREGISRRSAAARSSVPLHSDSTNSDLEHLNFGAVGAVLQVVVFVVVRLID